MAVGNLSCLITPGARRFTRWKLLLLLGVVCLPLFATGCICLSFGGWDHESCEHKSSDEVFKQHGSLPPGNGEPITVYYPFPYASPPNLEVRDTFHKCRIIDQRADCFRVVQEIPGESFTWTARGVKSPPPVPAVQVVPTAVAATPALNEPQPVVPTAFSR